VFGEQAAQHHAQEVCRRREEKLENKPRRFLFDFSTKEAFAYCRFYNIIGLPYHARKPVPVAYRTGV
jgi:hypothetical protein